MAPPTRRRKRDPAAATVAPAIDPADRLSKLPEEVLAQILSFLPVQEAVRSCVLARAWRDVWKLSRRLLITGSTVQEVRGFVDPLDDDPEGMSCVNSWIRRALQCQVRTLWVDLRTYLQMSTRPLPRRT